MEREVYLYPYSQADARRLGESSLWQASFQANVSCARDIEGAIHACSDTDGSLRPEASQSILDRWGFRRTIFVLTSTLRDAGYDQYLSEENRQWQKSAYIPDDGIYNRYFTVDTAGVCLDAFISQVREAYDRLELFGPEQCEPNSFEKLNYEGKVLVLAPDTLKESYKDATDLIHQAAGTGPPQLIRRLTPLECERLQGFPDGWTDLPGASDSARYRALGNSVAIPCVEFIMRGVIIAAGYSA